MLSPNPVSFKNLVCLLKKCNINAAESEQKSAGQFFSGFKQPLRAAANLLQDLRNETCMFTLSASFAHRPGGGGRFLQLTQIQ